LGATACDRGDDACACSDEYSGPPQDLRPAFAEIEAECAGVFTGHATENAGANGAVLCRYAAMSYSLEIHLTGDPACVGDEGEADCGNALTGEVEFAGELVADDTTYEVSGFGTVFCQDQDEVLAECFYDVINPTPGELPSLDESSGQKGLGITHIGWRHEDFDQGDYLDWEYCAFTMEQHTPPE
jgi:hypothetical protein